MSETKPRLYPIDDGFGDGFDERILREDILKEDILIKHRYELEIKIGFHDLKHLYYILNSTAFDIHKHFEGTDKNMNSVSGYPTYGSSIMCIFNKEITQDKYFEELEKRRLKEDENNKD